MIDFTKALDIIRALNHEQVEYIVFGGIAVNFHGLRRVTEDIDFFVEQSPENVARIKRALRSIWSDPAIDEIQDEDMIGDYPSFSYNPPDEDFGIDFVSRLGEAFSYDDLQAELREIEGVPVRVATPDTLYRMKRDTVRPQDKLDAMKLREKFDLKE